MGSIADGIPMAFDEDAHAYVCAQYISPRQREVLQIMLDNEDGEDGELVLNGGEIWLGLDRLSHRTLQALIGMMAIECNGLGTSYELWTINGTGKRILEKCK